MIKLLVLFILIMIITISLMAILFLLAVKLGLFEIKDSPDSISWEQFKNDIKKIFNAQE